MTDPDTLRAALRAANVAAFLRVIRSGESSQLDSAYTELYGGQQFTSFADHPRIGFVLPSGQITTAAGAYQITKTTWDGLVKQYGKTVFPDFSPASQDLAAVALIAGRGALNYVLLGNIRSAIVALGEEWTSLPAGAESTGRTFAGAEAVYAQWGGLLTPVAATTVPSAPQPQVAAPAVTPPTQGNNMGAGLVMALVQSILGAFAPLAQEKIAGAIAQHTDNPDIANSIAQNVMDAAMKLTGKSDPVEATVAVKADPAIVASVQADALSYLDKLAPVLDKIAQYDAQANAALIVGADAAQARGAKDKWDMAPFLAKSTMFIVGAAIIAWMVGLAVQIATSPTHDPSVALVALGMPIITLMAGNIKEMFAYRFDGTPKSNASDAAIAQVNHV